MRFFNFKNIKINEKIKREWEKNPLMIFGTYIGVIIIIITAVKSCDKEDKQTNLKVIGECSSINVPSNYKTEIDNFFKDTVISYFSHLPYSYFKYPSALPVMFSKALKEKFPQDISCLWDFKSYWNFTIENKGKKATSSLKLQVPFQGIYLITKMGEQQLNIFNNVIKNIGDLNPGDVTKIEIWTSENYCDSTEKAIVLNDANGCYHISYIHSVQPSFKGWLREAKPIYVLGIIITFASILLFCIVVIKIKTNNKNSPNNYIRPEAPHTLIE
ncbi:MAG: hypothetical protein PHE49_06760 [bacterium]|nr:hypothetical protein [bacterium]